MVFAAGESIGSMPAHPKDGRAGWSFGASLAVHALLGLALLMVVAPPPPIFLPEDSVSVDVLTPQEFDAASGAPAAETPAAKSPDLSPTPTVETKTSEFARLPTDRPAKGAVGMIRATHLMAAKILADSRSAKAAKAMKGLASSERIVQLCNIEAMEQIHTWKAGLEPDFLVAYAMADTRMSGNKVEADGAAFRSKRRWFNVAFTCEVTPDLAGVAAFSFLVGEEIPKSEWRDHTLAAEDGAAD